MLDWAVDQLVSRWSGSFGDAVGASVNVQTLSGLVTDWGQVQSLLMTGLRELFSSGAAVLSTLATLALTPVVAFYWLRDWPLMVTQLQRFVPPTSSAKVQVLATECDSVLSGFFRGQLMVMIALAVIYSVGLSLLGLKGSLAIGVVAGLFSVVPYLGTVIGLLIGVLAALYQFQDVLHPSLVLAVFLVGQLSEGMLLTPWLVGDRIGLHPVAVIFALMAGGQLFGFVGILIALPVVAVLVVAVRHLLLDRLTFEPRPGVENESSATSSDAASDGVVQAPNPRPED
jgi:predicted PurR-regulated permease PerM